MGRYICYIAESKVGKEWKEIDGWESDNDRSNACYLFGYEHKSVKPIVEPRGLPNDSLYLNTKLKEPTNNSVYTYEVPDATTHKEDIETTWETSYMTWMTKEEIIKDGRLKEFDWWWQDILKLPDNSRLIIWWE